MVILGLFVGGLDTGMFKLLELFLNKASNLLLWHCDIMP